MIQTVFNTVFEFFLEVFRGFFLDRLFLGRLFQIYIFYIQYCIQLPGKQTIQLLVFHSNAIQMPCSRTLQTTLCKHMSTGTKFGKIRKISKNKTIQENIRFLYVFIGFLPISSRTKSNIEEQNNQGKIKEQKNPGTIQELIRKTYY